MSSRRATIRIPDFHMSEELKDGKKKNYVVYHVQVTNGKWDHTVYRRYTNFEEFHRAWGALYPSLADKHQLPNNANLVLDNPKYLLMNAAEKAEARRTKLEAYLRDTLAIDAILDFFVPFLECEKTDLKAKVAAVDEDLKPKPANQKKDDDDTKTTASGLKIVSAIPQNEHLKATKGNDYHASKKANKHKARFEAKYKDVIADPTAAVTLNLTRADAPGASDAASPPLSPRDDGPPPPRPPPKPQKFGTAPPAAVKPSGNGGISGSATVSGAGGAGGAGLLVTAVALFDFTPPSDKPDCIALKKDEQVTVVEQSSDDWWFGKRGDGKDGFFPANYVKITKTTAIPKAPPPRPPASALFGGTAAAAGAGAGTGTGAGVRPGGTLSAAQVKSVKRHSTPMNLVSSADKPVSLLSPAALAAARGVRSDDDEEEDKPKPRPPPPRPSNAGAANVVIQKPSRAATFQIGAGNTAAADAPAAKPRPPPPRPSSAASSPQVAPAVPAPGSAVPPPRPLAGAGRAPPPPMSAALKSSIAQTPSLRPTPKPAPKPFGGIVAAAAVNINSGHSNNGGSGSGAAALGRGPSASVAISRGTSASAAPAPKRPPPAPVATAKFGAAKDSVVSPKPPPSPSPAATAAGGVLKKFCTHCGKAIDTASGKVQAFCIHCGGKL